MTRAEHTALGLNSDGVALRYIDRVGRRRVVGGPRLKSTQSYSRQFGKMMATLHKRYTIKEHLKDRARRATFTGVPDVSAMLDTWCDAHLDPVIRFVSRRAQRRQSVP